MTSGWSWYVILLTVGNIAAAAALLFWARTRRVATTNQGQTLGHEFDGIEEYDLPLPRWWLWLFVGTIVFSVVYFLLYPGFGSFRGTLDWTQQSQYAAEMRAAEARYGTLYAAYAAQPLDTLAHDPRALRIGQRVFANHCTACHGADAQGGVGYPNLTDGDWLYGGQPEIIKATILHGRMGVMPAFAPALGGDQGVKDVIAYVRSLSGLQTAEGNLESGKQKFGGICAACHGPEGKGNAAIGAPNLTDNVWLFSSAPDAIEEGLRKGRMSKMPAHKDILGEQKAHLVAAYIYSLSRDGGGAAQ